MFGIGLPELILIMIVALLVVGPKKLPDLARSLGKALHDVKNMTDDVKQSFEQNFAEDDHPDQDKDEAVGDGQTDAGDAAAAGEPGFDIPGEGKPDEEHAAGEPEEKSGPVEGSSTAGSDGYSNLRG